MAEDWSAIAAEVDAAIKSIGQTDAGFPVTLKRAGTPTGDPWDPIPGSPSYTTFTAVDDRRELRDANGTLIGQTRRTLTVGALTGVVPNDDDTIAVGVTEDQVDGQTEFLAILAVRPLSPAGVDVLYEIDVAS